MKLTIEDIKRIISEDEQEYLERIYWEAYIESEHGDAGDR